MALLLPRALRAVPALLLLLLVPATALARTPVILVSIDGFRADYMGQGATPVLDRLAASGVRSEGLRPSFPSLTFPNHYTLVTGLRPDRHGMVDNVMRDARRPGVTYSMSNRSETNDRFWWDGAEPLWVTAEKAGLRTATMFWPGSESDIRGVRPGTWLTYDKSMTAEVRVTRLLEWMGRPADQRPAFATLYFDDVDTAGHQHGPAAPETRAAVERIDRAIGALVEGLERLGLPVNLVVVADHGMSATSPDRVIEVESLVPSGAIDLVTQGSAAGFAALPGREAEVRKALQQRHPNAECWARSEIPERLHYGSHPRVPPYLCLARPGWLILGRATLARRPVQAGGAHGYDPADPDMAGLFVASGPAFRRGEVLPAFDNVDVHPLLMGLLGLSGPPTDGDPAVTRRALQPDALRTVP
jgi:predicted AlkP superfamily pyrophosphatase or phosphodiesterase